MCLMVICTKQHLSKIWSSIHENEKLSNTEAELLIKKTLTSSLAKVSVFAFLIDMFLFDKNTSVEVLP